FPIQKLSRSGRLAHSSKRVGLSLSAAFSYSLGKIREYHGEPKPHRHPSGEPTGGGEGGGKEIANEHQRRQSAAHFHYKHDWIFCNQPGRELANTIRCSLF